MPAAAVTPAPIVYTKVVAVKKLVVDYRIFVAVLLNKKILFFFFFSFFFFFYKKKEKRKNKIK